MKKVRWSSSWKFFPKTRRFFKNLKWEILWRFHPEHRYNIVKTNLEIGYHDIDTRMLHACFGLLCEFVEAEHGGIANLNNFIEEYRQEYCFEKDEEIPPYLLEAKDIYNWWTVQRSDAWKEFNKEFDDYHANVEMKLHSDESYGGAKRIEFVDNNSVKKDSSYFHEKEKALHQKDEEMLIRLMKIRRHLWT